MQISLLSQDNHFLEIIIIHIQLIINFDVELHRKSVDICDFIIHVIIQNLRKKEEDKKSSFSFIRVVTYTCPRDETLNDGS